MKQSNQNPNPLSPILAPTQQIISKSYHNVSKLLHKEHVIAQLAYENHIPFHNFSHFLIAYPYFQLLYFFNSIDSLFLCNIVGVQRQDSSG